MFPKSKRGHIMPRILGGTFLSNTTFYNDNFKIGKLFWGSIMPFSISHIGLLMRKSHSPMGWVVIDYHTTKNHSWGNGLLEPTNSLTCFLDARSPGCFIITRGRYEDLTICRIQNHVSVSKSSTWSLASTWNCPTLVSYWLNPDRRTSEPTL